MNMSELQYLEDHTVAIRAEQAVLGSLLRDNDALDRIIDLEAAHFHRNDHRMIFETITRQVAAGQRADPMTVYAELGAKVEDCLPYLSKLRASAASSVNIAHHAAIISDKARKRALGLLAVEMQELAVSFQPAAACVDLMASKLEALAQQKTDEEPKLMAEMMGEYRCWRRSPTLCSTSGRPSRAAAPARQRRACYMPATSSAHATSYLAGTRHASWAPWWRCRA